MLDALCTLSSKEIKREAEEKKKNVCVGKPDQETFLKQFKQIVKNKNKKTWSKFRMDY